MTYTEIYDFEGESTHSQPKWFVDDDGVGRWRYYEGYAQSSAEKDRFQESINTDHELWSGAHKTPSVKTLPTNKLTFSDKVINAILPELGTDLVTGDALCSTTDMRDRSQRPSPVFAQMICDYIEKARLPEDRKRFFDYGGWGYKWSKDKDLMDSLKPLFESAEMQFEDPEFNLSLSDQTIKRSSGGYPRVRFFEVYDLFLKSQEHGPRFNPNAEPFTFGVRPVNNTLARTGPAKICGAYLVKDLSVTPLGVPPPRRPTASCKNSTAHVQWSKNDADYESLSKKLDLLMALHGPVVHAELV